MTSTTDPRDRLFALIASIPGSGTVDWCGPARALLDEIAAPPVSSSGRAALLHETALSDTERRILSYALGLAEEEMLARGDDEDELEALKALRRVAAEEQPAETQTALLQAHTVLAAQAGRDQRAVARVRQLHDALAAETALTSPDDKITRGAAARKIAAALDGERPVVWEQPDTQEAP